MRERLRGQRRILIDPDGDGYTHLVVGAGVTSFSVALPLWRKGAARLVVQGRVIQSTGIAALIFRPQGSTTNQTQASTIWFAGGGSVATAAGTSLRVASPSEGTTLQTDFDFTFTLPTGARRYWESKGSSFVSTPRTERRFLDSGYWDDTVTEITSFDIVSDISGALLAGTWLKAFLEFDR
jgi:hypothetical protein